MDRNAAQFGALILLAAVSRFSWADVQPDGATATSVAVDIDGRELVTIAPPNAARISYNSYTRFDVGSAGVAFDNRGVGARTLVNEVTSVHPSLIQGEVRILGAPANTIIANPNGITVNGGRFVNTGSLGLITGRVSITNDGSRDVVRATTSSGQLQIGAEGLSGTFNHLDLIAKQIRLDGPVVNTNEDRAASANLIAGDSEVDFFADASVVSPATNWRRLNSGGVESTATAISIAAKASLVGSRIDVVVTDQGAGVNHAGLMSATAGSFTLDSSGQVIVDGGAIEALAVVDIKASDLMIRTDPDREEQARIEAIAGGMHIDVSGDFENYGARLQSYARSVLDEDAEGGFTLDVGGDFLNYSLSRSQLAILFAENDDLVIHVAGDAINDAGRLVGNKNIRIHSEGDFTNLTDISDFARRGQFVTTRRQGDALWYALYTQREQIYLTRVDYGQSRIPGQLAYVVANGDVDIQAKNFINHGGEIDANEGSFTLDAKSVVNEGLLQGSAWIERRCSYLGCSESGHSDVSLIGGLISASDSIDIQADDFLHNIGGRLYAVNDIDITAPEVFHAAVVVTDVIERNAGLKDLFHHDHAKFVRGDQGGSMVASNGVLTITARDRIELMGSELLGGRGVNTNIEPEVLRERFQQAPIFADDIGLLQNW